MRLCCRWLISNESLASEMSHITIAIWNREQCLPDLVLWKGVSLRPLNVTQLPKSVASIDMLSFGHGAPSNVQLKVNNCHGMIFTSSFHSFIIFGALFYTGFQRRLTSRWHDMISYQWTSMILQTIQILYNSLGDSQMSIYLYGDIRNWCPHGIVTQKKKASIQIPAMYRLWTIPVD